MDESKKKITTVNTERKVELDENIKKVNREIIKSHRSKLRKNEGKIISNIEENPKLLSYMNKAKNISTESESFKAGEEYRNDPSKICLMPTVHCKPVISTGHVEHIDDEIFSQSHENKFND